MVCAQLGLADLIPKYIHQATVTDPNQMTALMFASSNGHLDCVKQLTCEAGAKHYYTYTALTKAIHNQFRDIANLLFHYPGEINDKQTQLMYASKNNLIE